MLDIEVTNTTLSDAKVMMSHESVSPSPSSSRSHGPRKTAVMKHLEELEKLKTSKCLTILM
jgi:hypothetical protein